VLSNTSKYILLFCFVYFLPSLGYSQEAIDERFPEVSGLEELKYNENYSLACHNCYETKYTSEIEEVFSYTNTIELDIWDSEIFYGFFNDWCGGKRMEKDWYIKHTPYENGNANCFKGSFRKSLKRLLRWSNENPGHDVVTVFIDKKENWSNDDESRKPGDLDELILSIFGKEKIYSPAGLLQNKNYLKKAVPTNWPSLSALKDKFIFVITDAGFNNNGRNILDEYLDERRNDAVCFVAPRVSGDDEIFDPEGISPRNAKNIVFYNMHYKNRELSRKINSLGFISRVYGSPEDIDAFSELIKRKVNFVAMYNYKLK